MPKKVLFIGLVWPEPTSSAAGTRILQLIKVFIAQGDEVIFASAAAQTGHSFNLALLSVKMQPIVLNHASFCELIKYLQPDTVVFDRFISEEQFGWQVRQECPNALLVLDTEDLHFLRIARQDAFKKGLVFTPEQLFSETAKREIAAILRCDISLIISEEEMNILVNQFNINHSLLHYLPFLEEEITDAKSKSWPGFKERTDFVFIGNFLHQPNCNAVQYLKFWVWPVIHKALPQAHMHVYGAYIPEKVVQLHQAAQNFEIMGRANDAQTTLKNYKILLAPLQFGAGLKGKLIDAMQAGTPTVTTSIGAEAMPGNLPWNGVIENDPIILATKAIELYQNQTMWYKAQNNGITILNHRYAKTKWIPPFIQRLQQLSEHLNLHRQQNFVGQILHHHTQQSTKYLSLWIQEKNKLNI